MELNSRQAAFISEYLIDRNGAQAAIRAGYSPKAAKEQASRLLTNANIRRAIAQKCTEAEERLQISRDDVLNGLVSAFEVAREAKDPQTMIAACRELGRLQGYYEQSTDKRRRQSGVGASTLRQIAGMSDDELMEILEGGGPEGGLEER